MNLAKIGVAAVALALPVVAIFGWWPSRRLATAEETLKQTTSINDFGLQLLSYLSAKNQNAAVSPLTIGSCLGVLQQASGPSQTAVFSKRLGFLYDQERSSASFSDILDANTTRSSRLNSVPSNSVWRATNLTVEPGFQREVGSRFRSSFGEFTSKRISSRTGCEAAFESSKVF